MDAAQQKRNIEDLAKQAKEKLPDLCGSVTFHMNPHIERVKVEVHESHSIKTK